MEKLIKSIQSLFSPKSNAISAPISDDKEKIMYKQIQECRDTHDVLLGPDVLILTWRNPLWMISGMSISIQTLKIVI
jgi:hypothetical protein